MAPITNQEWSACGAGPPWPRLRRDREEMERITAKERKEREKAEMNCKAVPLQSPVSHCARWVGMGNKSRTPTGFHIESHKVRSGQTVINSFFAVPSFLGELGELCERISGMEWWKRGHVHSIIPAVEHGLFHGFWITYSRLGYLAQRFFRDLIQLPGAGQ